jgi:D-tyrosyl-tRNA(Tyr) deacylase
MIGLLQRVSEARVVVDGRTVGAISRGLLVLLAVEPDDGPAEADRLVERLVGYRVFPDGEDRMNLSVSDIGGDLLLVPQFTLAADTRKGMRPSFTRAAAPELGRKLFDCAAEAARRKLPGKVATGEFGAQMQVSLTNDGPVTFWLRTSAGQPNGGTS